MAKLSGKLIPVLKYVRTRFGYWLINDYPLISARIRDPVITLLSAVAPPFVAKGPTQELCVKAMCQVKADSDIIEDWILWHGYLFGMHNICVIADRPSPETAEILSRYSGRITILQAPLGDWPAHLSWCERKTYNLNHAIRTLAGSSDFVFPLDSDEFVIFEDKPDKKLVLRELIRLQSINIGGFKFGQELQSCYLARTTRPAVEICSFRRHRINYVEKKCFAIPKSLTWMGAGQHYVHTCGNRQAMVSRLSLLHFRWRGVNHMYEKCLDHYSQEVVLPDGSEALPRVGDHIRRGAEAIEQGSFSEWAASVVGSPNRRITGLSGHLAKLQH